MCNHCSAFSVCCYVIITKLAPYNEKSRGYAVVGEFFFKQLHYNFLFHLSVWCVTILLHFLSVVVSQLSNLCIIMETLTCVPCGERLFFKRFNRYDSSPLKCVICNHFVAFFPPLLCQNY